MAIVNIPTTEEKYLIFINGENVSYIHSEIGMQTSYCDACWTKEEFTTEAAWLTRLLDFDIVPE